MVLMFKQGNYYKLRKDKLAQAVTVDDNTSIELYNDISERDIRVHNTLAEFQSSISQIEWDKILNYEIPTLINMQDIYFIININGIVFRYDISDRKIRKDNYSDKHYFTHVFKGNTYRDFIQKLLSIHNGFDYITDDYVLSDIYMIMFMTHLLNSNSIITDDVIDILEYEMDGIFQ